MANILATKSHSHKINTNIMQMYGPLNIVAKKKKQMKYRIFVLDRFSFALPFPPLFAISISCFVSLAFLHIQFIHRLYIFMQRFRLYGEWEVESVARASHVKCALRVRVLRVCAYILYEWLCDFRMFFRARARKQQNLTPCPSATNNIKRQYYRFT